MENDWENRSFTYSDEELKQSYHDSDDQSNDSYNDSSSVDEDLRSVLKIFVHNLK